MFCVLSIKLPVWIEQKWYGIVLKRFSGWFDVGAGTEVSSSIFLIPFVQLPKWKKFGNSPVNDHNCNIFPDISCYCLLQGRHSHDERLLPLPLNGRKNRALFHPDPPVS